MGAGATRRKSSGEIPGCRDIWMLEAAMKEGYERSGKKAWNDNGPYPLERWRGQAP